MRVRDHSGIHSDFQASLGYLQHETASKTPSPSDELKLGLENSDLPVGCFSPPVSCDSPQFATLPSGCSTNRLLQSSLPSPWKEFPRVWAQLVPHLTYHLHSPCFGSVFLEVALIIQLMLLSNPRSSYSGLLSVRIKNVPDYARLIRVL